MLVLSGFGLDGRSETVFSQPGVKQCERRRQKYFEVPNFRLKMSVFAVVFGGFSVGS